MHITSRPYRPADYNSLMDFLRGVYELNQNQHSWLPARWEYAFYLVKPLYETRAVSRSLESTIRIWQADDHSIAGFVNSENPDDTCFIQIHPAHRHLEKEMIDWAEKQLALPQPGTGLRRIRIWAHDTDTPRTSALTERGYSPHQKCEYLTAQHLDRDLPLPALPQGYSVLSAADGASVASRCEASGKAFGSESLPLSVYNTMQSTDLYKPELDLNVVLDNGEVAAFCTVWFDPINKTGYFEPVGTHPDHQRRGLGKAILLEGLRRLRLLGAKMAYVGAWDDWRLRFYASAGFIVMDRYRPWAKTLPALLPHITP